MNTVKETELRKLWDSTPKDATGRPVLPGMDVWIAVLGVEPVRIIALRDTAAEVSVYRYRGIHEVHSLANIYVNQSDAIAAHEKRNSPAPAGDALRAQGDQSAKMAASLSDKLADANAQIDALREQQKETARKLHLATAEWDNHRDILIQALDKANGTTEYWRQKAERLADAMKVVEEVESYTRKA